MKIYEKKENYKWFKFYVEILLIVQAVFITLGVYNEITSLEETFEIVDWTSKSSILLLFWMLVTEAITVILFVNQIMNVRKKNKDSVFGILLYLKYMVVVSIINRIILYDGAEMVGGITGILLYYIPNIIYFGNRKDGFEDYIEEKISDSTIRTKEEQVYVENNILLDEKSEIIDKATLSNEQKIDLIKNKDLYSIDELKNKINEINGLEHNYCPQCGKKVDANWKFCKYCGGRITEE